MLFSALFRKNISKASDLDLIVLIKKSNNAANGELFKRYATLLMGLCLKYMKRQDIAEDMLMNIFEKLPAKIQKHEITNLKSWLYSVARNECLMELRKKKQDTGDIESALIYATDKSDEALSEMLLKEEKLTLLEQNLTYLKTEQREAITLFYIKNKSYDEVSLLMKVTVKKVKSLIQNGKRNLKLKLTDELE